MHLPPQTAAAEAAQQRWLCSTESPKKENSDTINNIVVGGRGEFEEDQGVVVGSLKPVTTNNFSTLQSMFNGNYSNIMIVVVVVVVMVLVVV